MYIHGIGHFHPETVISNQFLEELDIGTSDEWIMERVGIRTRRTILPLDYIKETKNQDLRAAIEAAQYNNAEVGRRAGEIAIKHAGLTKADIGMVIGGSSVNETVTPAQAASVAAALELEVPVFDVLSACTSFHAALYLLSLMDPNKLPRFILLSETECLTPVVDYADRTQAVLWGDAAVSLVVSTREPSPAQILNNNFHSNPAGWHHVVVPRTAHFRQDGRTVQKFAISKASSMVKRLQEEFQTPERRFYFIGHQANLLMLEAVCRQCKIPEERHLYNIVEYGNTATAGSASVISMNWDRFTADDDIAVAGVGAGLTWSSYLLRFGERS